MRICSFLPSATEIVYALGLGDELYGVTHECDYPIEAKQKPILTASTLAKSNDSKEIDSSVRQALRAGDPIYTLDYEALARASPDVIFTQALCEVCAVSYGEIQRASSKLPKQPEIVSLDTFTLKDILGSIFTVGGKCGRRKEAEDLVASLNRRIEYATLAAAGATKKKVFFMEWIDPIMSGGHWMAELIARAGGDDIFAVHGKKSQVVDEDVLFEYAPDYLVIAPCGFGVAQTEREAKKKMHDWENIPAVQNRKVYAADGNAYYSRPGPRIVDGLEIMTVILNPETRSRYVRYGESDFKLIS